MKEIHVTNTGPYRDGYGPTTGVAAFRRISWGAVFAGVIVALGIQFALSMLGLGIGMGAIDPYSQNPASGLGIGSVIWFGISTILALFTGGWVAAHLAGIPKTSDSLLHGILTWCLFTLFSFYLLTTAVGSIISGVTGVVGRALSLAGQGIEAVAPEVGGAIQQELQDRNITLSTVKQEAAAWLRATEDPALQPEQIREQARESRQEVAQGASQAAARPQQAGQTLDDIVDNLFARAGETVEAVDRDAAVTALMNRTGRSRAEAERTVDGWIQTYQQARAQLQQTGQNVGEKARATAEDVSSAISKAAIYAFIAMLLGALAAAIGGATGRPHEVVQTVS
jgi:hypothetical protein